MFELDIHMRICTLSPSLRVSTTVGIAGEKVCRGLGFLRSTASNKFVQHMKATTETQVAKRLLTSTP